MSPGVQEELFLILWKKRNSLTQLSQVLYTVHVIALHEKDTIQITDVSALPIAIVLHQRFTLDL